MGRLALRSDPGFHATETADGEVVAQSSADPLTFDDLYERYADAILNYCYYRLGNWDEAEFTGTGFPQVFYLRYHYYRLYFPLIALARYERATRPAEPGGY